ncbi:DJ-1/PfpI family protein [Bacillus sp. FSL K6-1338]|uniref:DJ-1/PfpI family protein n=1 Tax=Bacillus sp. FSL K6-1338 TaxID=2976833 RepID=UPI0030F7F93E|nr:DJ-1/PfpI family protein [Bacillus cereus]
MKFQVVLFDGFDLMDAIAPFDVFNAAAGLSPEEVTVELVTVEGKRFVNSGVDNVRVEASGILDPNAEGVILIPGSSGDSYEDGPNSIVNRLKRASETELKTLLHQAAKNPNITLNIVCVGANLLGMIGLLNGRYASTHFMGMDALPKMGAIPVHARIVDDGDIVSSGGVTSGIDLAIYTIEQKLGSKIAHAVEKLFEFERRSTVWKNEGQNPVAF